MGIARVSVVSNSSTYRCGAPGKGFTMLTDVIQRCQYPGIKLGFGGLSEAICPTTASLLTVAE